MKIKLTKDIFEKLLEAGFIEGEQLDFKRPPKSKGGGVTTQDDKPKPGEHPPTPPTVP